MSIKKLKHSLPDRKISSPPRTCAWDSDPRTLRAALAAAGAAAYERSRHLPCLLPLTPGDVSGQRPGRTAQIVTMLKAAIRKERVKGRSGDGTYDLIRHMCLTIALKVESRRLNGAKRKNIAPPRRSGR